MWKHVLMIVVGLAMLAAGFWMFLVRTPAPSISAAENVVHARMFAVLMIVGFVIFAIGCSVCIKNVSSEGDWLGY